MIFAIKSKTHRKYRFIWSPKANNVRIYNVLYSKGFKRHGNTAQWTIFKGRQKCETKLCCQLQPKPQRQQQLLLLQQQQQQEDEEEGEEKEEEKEQEQSSNKKRTSHCALHLRASSGHMNNTNAHIAIHSPYGIAGVRSSTIIHATCFIIEFDSHKPILIPAIPPPPATLL